ncbi:MAG: DUF1080 domain-containing protein [Sedimentisphaerales bacterium]|nr:DUF1080 domain-containing protein [Sedimentisphaerales bacterium]
MRRWVFGVGFLWLAVVTGQAFAERIDPLMGDWQGKYETTYGDHGQFVSQIIALGDGKYQIKNLDQFDTRTEPMHVLDAVLKGSHVTFSSPDNVWEGQGTVEGDVFKGKFSGEDSGDFEMHHVVRLSPTLGVKPPSGAIVLFDGKDFKEWEAVGSFAGLVDLATLIGGDNAAAYLVSRIWSQSNQNGVLEVGSDDGVKVWLNDRLIHANNASRGVTPGQDKVKVEFKTGWNELMLKVVNGAGGWGACARLADEQGKILEGVYETPVKENGWAATRESFEKNNGFLTIWMITGPYRSEGKDGSQIFDVKMGPELEGKECKWIPIKLGDDKDQVKWKIVDGAMQVGGSSIVTKRKFKDFKLHIEFRTPFMPTARGQGRGNSGVYVQGRYEVQVLDSYGLEGADNECGGIYQVGRPAVNMCAPPLQWQTYDMDFKAPQFDKEGRKTSPAVLTVVHNGVTIHYERVLPGPTGGALDGNVDQSGGIMLQDHGNPVQFRNIWIVETSDSIGK